MGGADPVELFLLPDRLVGSEVEYVFFDMGAKLFVLSHLFRLEVELVKVAFNNAAFGITDLLFCAGIAVSHLQMDNSGVRRHSDLVVFKIEAGLGLFDGVERDFCCMTQIDQKVTGDWHDMVFFHAVVFHVDTAIFLDLNKHTDSARVSYC